MRKQEHSDWVKSLADKLLADGIETIIDNYDVSSSDRLSKFMESSIRDSDYVIIIYTEKYKSKANNIEKGVGYDGIARIDSDRIILDGTTIEEVKQYHRDTLILCVEKQMKKK